MLANISNYKMVRLIGAGGMGEVYEAMHDKIERRAAIKVLRSTFAENQEVVQRFLNEARAVNIIGHPSLVNIYEFGVASDNSPYIVMEFLEGETLRQRLTRTGHFPPREAMAITRQIASALAAAHAKHIVHRDLKPVNVMVVPDADMVDGERVKVLDFGIAKLVSEVGSEVLTRTGTSMGTPRYMSPEQCKSARDVTDRSDIYTLGLMLYEMLCGESPYADVKSEVMLMSAQMFEPAPPLASKGTEASAELCALVHRMLDKNPESRPSASDVLLTLRRMTGGLPSIAMPTIPRVLGARAPDPTHSGYSSPGLTAATLPAAGTKPPLASGRYLIAVAVATLLLGLIGVVLVLRSLRHPAAPSQPVAAYWHIVSDPGDAEVVDDSGAVVGRTPLARLQPPETGPVTFTLRHPGFVERRVTLTHGDDRQGTVTLVPLPVPPTPTGPPAKSSSALKKNGKNKKRGSHRR